MKVTAILGIIAQVIIKEIINTIIINQSTPPQSIKLQRASIDTCLLANI